MTLLERDKTAPPVWHGELPVSSRYTFGLAGERFFRALKDEGVIYGTHCPKCEWTYVPAALFCERCLAELVEWVDVGTIGKIHTYTLLYKNYDGSPRETPELIAFISLGDGGIIHRIGGISPEEVEIGLEVQAVFKDENDREGSILDIVYFKPVSS